MDFGKQFSTILKNEMNGTYSITTSDYTQKTYYNDTYEIVMAFDAAVGTSAYTAYLSYSSFEKKWTWLLEWENQYAYGSFSTLSSASTGVPCSYSDFKASVASMMKSIFSTMVYNANAKLSQLNAGFTMENLGLKF